MAALCLASISASSEIFPTRPDEHDFIADAAQIIHTDDAAAIRGTAAAVRSKTGIPIVVVTIPSLSEYGGSDIGSYATELFNTWGIGSQNNNRGILLLVSRADRKARIELGADWGKSQDSASHRIMQDVIVPAFAHGDYSSGIRSGVEALADMSVRANRINVAIRWLEIAVFLLVIAAGISLIRNGKTGWGWALLAGAGALLLSALIWGRSSDDGGNFEGGSSGGGGDTGSW